MKKILQLQNLLNLVLWFSIAIIGLIIAAMIYAIAAHDLSKLNFNIHGVKIQTLDLPMAVFIGLVMIGYGFFMAALFQLKTLVSLFVGRHFFTDETVRALKKIGSFLMLAALLMMIPAFLLENYLNAAADVRIGSVSPESFFFLVIISLFFTTLSYIFKEAKRLQEESELTI